MWNNPKTPGNLLSRLTTQQGVILSELPPTSIVKVTGITKPTLPTGVKPDVNTPVLNLTVEKINVLSKLSTINPDAEYGVLGLWKNGHGYTMVGSEGYTYLNMPEVIYETFFKNYPGDFRLINEQYLADLVSQNKSFILETPFSEIPAGSSAYWEVETVIKNFDYIYKPEGGPSNYDILLPSK